MHSLPCVCCHYTGRTRTRHSGDLTARTGQDDLQACRSWNEAEIVADSHVAADGGLNTAQAYGRPLMALAKSEEKSGIFAATETLVIHVGCRGPIGPVAGRGPIGGAVSSSCWQGGVA